MREIVKRLFENRLDEKTRSKSIEALCDELRRIIDTDYRNITITPDTQKGVAVLKYGDTGEEYYISPGIVGERTVDSSTAVSIKNYKDVRFEGDSFYDANGEFIGKALVRVSRTYHPKDYSPHLGDATISKKIVN